MAELGAASYANNCGPAVKEILTMARPLRLDETLPELMERYREMSRPKHAERSFVLTVMCVKPDREPIERELHVLRGPSDEELNERWIRVRERQRVAALRSFGPVCDGTGDPQRFMGEHLRLGPAKGADRVRPFQ